MGYRSRPITEATAGDAMSGQRDPDDLRAMFDSPYIGAWSLQGKDVTVTIRKITGGTVTGLGGTKSLKPIVHFVGAAKPMVGGAWLRDALYSLFGTYSAKELKGKRVTLYPTQCKGKSGGMVDCIRIRPSKPTGPDSGSRLDAPVDPTMRAKQAAEVEGREPGSDDQ